MTYNKNMKTHKETLQEWRARRKKMLEYREKGVTLVDIGRIFGITKQRVYEIIQKEKSKDLTR